VPRSAACEREGNRMEGLTAVVLVIALWLVLRFVLGKAGLPT